MKICYMCDYSFSGVDWHCPSCRSMPESINGFLAFSPELAVANDGFNPDGFAQLASVEEHNFWFRARNNLLIWALRSYFPEAKSLFEIGCGTGFVLSRIESEFPWRSLYGAEIYSVGLDVAAKRLRNVNLFQMDARKIPFKEEFDVIGAFDVLEHVEQDELVLTQMHQATKSGGGIILTVPQHAFLWSKVDECAHHVRRYSARELKAKVEQAGFKIVKATSFVSLLLPLMLASRLLKQDREVIDTMSELEIRGIANTILEKILDFERGLIRLGIPLPFGGSMLIVAQKVWD